jgi:hypothetical protein
MTLDHAGRAVRRGVLRLTGGNVRPERLACSAAKEQMVRWSFSWLIAG